MTIKEIRKQRGMTQVQLADESGVKLTTLQKIERGTSSIMQVRFETVVHLAKALNVSIEEFIK